MQMEMRQIFGAIIGAFALLTMWGALHVLTLRGDEAGLVTLALIGVVIIALCVGWPLLLLAATYALPDRFRPRRSVLVVAALLAALPGVLAIPALGSTLTDIAVGDPRAGGHLAEVGLYLFPFVPSVLLFREAVNRAPRHQPEAL